MGVDVYKIRYIAVLIGAAFAGAGGAYYTTTLLGTFILNVTFSRGFIALALIYFGKWKPYRVLLPLIIFSFVDSLQLGLQGAGDSGQVLLSEYASLHHDRCIDSNSGKRSGCSRCSDGALQERRIGETASF